MSEIRLERQQEIKERLSKTVVEIGSRFSPAFIILGLDNLWFRNEVAGSQYICIDVIDMTLEWIPEESTYKDPEYNKFLDSLKIKKVYANGLSLPFKEESLDDVVLVNVLNFRVSETTKIQDSSHLVDLNKKDFESGALTADKMEKLLEEIYIKLKIGGKLIVANFYSTIDKEATTYIVDGLKNDKRYIPTIEKSGSEGLTRDVLIFTKL